MSDKRITSPNDPELRELAKLLSVRASEIDRTGAWPKEQLRLCAEYGVFEWFIPTEYGGQGWDAESIVRGYLALSAACLTTTFIITQLTGACKRIAAGENLDLKTELLPKLAAGEVFATVGISHLTTSRRHLNAPVLKAEITDGGYIFSGYSPWVTGGSHADYIVLGATLAVGEEFSDDQLLVVLPADTKGVHSPEPFQLVGVTGSHTGQVRLDHVFIPENQLLAGPKPNVMQGGVGANTGGYETSTLAIGLATAALNYLCLEAEKRDDLNQPKDALLQELDTLREDLLAIVRGEAACSNDELRRRANSLALRASQASLAAAKGAGYVIGHPTGRWCREALFFLVWSCPQPVLSANLCEMAGVEFLS